MGLEAAYLMLMPDSCPSFYSVNLCKNLSLCQTFEYLLIKLAIHWLELFGHLKPSNLGFSPACFLWCSHSLSREVELANLLLSSTVSVANLDQSVNLMALRDLLMRAYSKPEPS
jgi:hypothetical protein